jgi:hypothetical protein
MTDDEFLAAFEAGRVAKEDFHHRDHLRLAWACLRHAEEAEALARVRAAICRFAESHGVTPLYHETITRFWISRMAAVMRTSAAPDFASLAERHPELLDKDAIRRHYRPETLAGGEAKVRWVEPDLLQSGP